MTVAMATWREKRGGGAGRGKLEEGGGGGKTNITYNSTVQQNK